MTDLFYNPRRLGRVVVATSPGGHQIIRAGIPKEEGGYGVQWTCTCRKGGDYPKFLCDHGRNPDGTPRGGLQRFFHECQDVGVLSAYWTLSADGEVARRHCTCFDGGPPALGAPSPRPKRKATNARDRAAARNVRRYERLRDRARGLGLREGSGPMVPRDLIERAIEDELQDRAAVRWKKEREQEERRAARSAEETSRLQAWSRAAREKAAELRDRARATAAKAADAMSAIVDRLRAKAASKPKRERKK